jgi:hypothetical protein
VTSVLLVGVAVPPLLALESAIPAFREHGAAIDVATIRPWPPALRDLGVRTSRTPVLLRYPPGGVRRGSPRWALAAVRWRVLKIVQPRTGHALRTWRLVRQDPVVREMAQRADVMVALDRHAVYSVWRLARRTGVPAFFGVAPALEHVESLPVAPATMPVVPTGTAP